MSQHLTTVDKARVLVNARIDELNIELHQINRVLHDNPELAHEEFFAHNTLADCLAEHGFAVRRAAYGLETSFEAVIGTEGPQVVFCAEYDALPDIGHACGHNLIAMASLGAFFGAAHAISTLGIPGRIRILGTPAEEDGAGKVKLIDAGAFKTSDDILAAIMAHPVPSHQLLTNGSSFSGLASYSHIACHEFRVEYRGRAAHAAEDPWNGKNALDAAVSAYNNISYLRQHIRPDEKIHGVFEVAGTAPNVVPDYTRMNWYIRGPTTDKADQLRAKAQACMEAAATAMGCTINYIMAESYKNTICNPTLSKIYAENMAMLGETVKISDDQPSNGSTDMGNVTHEVPGFHGAFAIPTESPESALHTTEFATAARTTDAHEAAIKSAKGMAMLGLRVLMQDEAANDVRKAFAARLTT